MGRARTVNLPIVAQIGAAVAGVLLLVSAFVPWSGSGAGSSIAVRHVADLILSGTLEAWAPRWTGVIVYGVPLGGALLVLGAGLGNRAGLALAVPGVILALAGTILTTRALERLDREGWGVGTTAAVAGILLGTAATGCAFWARRGAAARPEPAT